MLFSFNGKINQLRNGSFSGKAWDSSMHPGKTRFSLSNNFLLSSREDTPFVNGRILSRFVNWPSYFSQVYTLVELCRLALAWLQ